MQIGEVRDAKRDSFQHQQGASAPVFPQRYKSAAQKETESYQAYQGFLTGGAGFRQGGRDDKIAPEGSPSQGQRARQQTLRILKHRSHLLTLYMILLAGSQGMGRKSYFPARRV